MKKTEETSLTISLWSGCLILLLLLGSVHAAEKGAPREEGQFNIYVSGREVGREKFQIQSSGDSVTSSSALTFRDPGSKRQFKIETELSMDARLVPQKYQVRTELDGQKAVMTGTYSAGRATYQYQVGGSPAKDVIMVGERFSVLDTNVFHHFIFIGRLFDFENGQNTQSMDVVIPQEIQNGILKVTNVGLEKISIRGKERELHHLRADSGAAKVDLWIDDQRILYKIAVPAKGIEILRD